MKNLFILILLLTSAGISVAQHANTIFFTENGEKFTVILNGVRKNDKPETNVKITGLNETPYQVKIIFADTSLGVIDDKIYGLNYKEVTYSIKSKTISSASKGLKKVGVNLGRQLKAGDKAEAAKEKAEIDSTNSKYVIRLMSETPIGVPPAGAASPSTSNNVKASGNSSTTTSSQQNNNTKNNSGNKKGNSTSMSVGAGHNATDNNTQFSMNVNVNASDTQHESQTTTTTTTNTTHFVMPGYGGPVGCPWPMSEGDFSSAKKSINDKSFEESKLTIAKQIIGSNCLVSGQVKEIMLLFSFEETRLDFAKFAYSFTYDIGNYYKVNDAFTFESSIEELNKHIESRR